MTSPTERLEGRLHPATILIHALRIVRGLAAAIILGIVQLVRSGSGAAFGGGMLVFVGVAAVVLPALHWARYRWRLVDDALEIDSGIVGRVTRRVPLARIQNIDTTQSVLHRVFGVVVLAIHTSSTPKAEAELDAIGHRDAERLMAALGTPRAVTSEPADAPAPLLTVTTRDLVLRGLTDNRAGLLVASGLTFLEQATGGGEGSPLRAGYRAARSIVLPVLGEGNVAIALFAGLALVLVWLLGYAASTLFNVLTFHGLTLRLEDGVFRREHGLFTRRRQALPRARIQALVLRQSPMRRWIGLASLEVHDMGSSADPSAQTTGSDGFVPAAAPEAIRALYPLAFAGFERSALVLRPVSVRMIRRGATLGLVLGAAVAAALAFVVHEHRLALLALPLVSGLGFALRARAAHAALRVGSGGGFYAIERGVFWREEVLVPSARIEAISVRSTPLDRYHRVATLEVVVGGGTRFTVANLPREEARSMLERLAEDADEVAAPTSA